MTQTELVRAKPAALPWMPLITVASLMVFLALAVAWMSSLTTAATWSMRIGNSAPYSTSAGGRLHFGLSTGRPTNLRIQDGWITSPLRSFAIWPPDRGWAFLGFDAQYRPRPGFPTWINYGVSVPYWFLCVLAMLLPARSLWIARRRWSRTRRGQCPMCGHDLHGERRCDSCGFVAGATSHDASQTNFSAPDWTTQVEPVLCPLCDYNLRALTEQRCPECGYRFTWPEVLDPVLRSHPYLFEQRDAHLVRSFLKTYIASLWPPALWQHLHPAQPISVKRLLVFWLLVSVPVIGLAAFLGVRGIVARQFIAWTLVPLASFLALLIYQISMRRARLRPAHVLRCVIYSSSWMPVLALIAWFARPWLPSYPVLGRSSIPTSTSLHMAIVFWAIFLTLPLTSAYSRYLRMSKPFFGILLIQILVVLIYTMFMMWRWI